MKKSLMMAFAIAALIACGDKSKEVVPAEETIENANDTLPETVSDTSNMVTNETILPSEETKVEAVKEKEEVKVVAANDIKVDYASFGSKISADKALTSQQMADKYKTMKTGDTVALKFKSKIKSVCKKKGCWMRLDLPNSKESFVRFRDYEFFVPLNADEGNHEAIVSGRAFVTETSVAELKHYAKDGGKSQAEIDKITEPKFTYAFLADGVLINK